MSAAWVLLGLWPIAGWLCGYLAAPKWMFKRDAWGYVIIFFCGAIVGPFGALWFFFQEKRR